MSDMSDSTDKVMYSARLPAEDAKIVEEYRDKYDLTKSKALRELVQKGITRETAGWAELAVLAAMVGTLMGVGTVFTAGVLVALAVASGLASVDPWFVFSMFATAAVGFGLTSAGFSVIQFFGIPAWVDERAGEWGRRLGVNR